VNNKTLADAVAGPGDFATDDKTSTDLQITEMKSFVGRHNDFMEVAYSPADLHRIVSANKLAVILGVETKSLLIGEGASPADVALIRSAAENGTDVERIIHMKTLYLGPDELLVAMKVAVAATRTAADVAAAINAVESRVRAAVPTARVLYIEPDIFDPARPIEGVGSAAAAPGPATDH